MQQEAEKLPWRFTGSPIFSTHDRQNLKSSNILILSPNGVFSDYISHILPELGEENIKEMSFDLFAYKQLRDTVSDCEDRYDEIERRIRFPQKASLQRKNSPWNL